jgi:hypothetical protein
VFGVVYLHSIDKNIACVCFHIPQEKTLKCTLFLGEYADRNCKENLRFDICKVMEKQCMGM